MEIQYLIIFFSIVIVGVVYYSLSKNKKEAVIDTSKSIAVLKQAELEANTKSREILIEAKDEALKIKNSAEQEVRTLREESINIEKKLEERSSKLDAKLESLEKKEAETKLYEKNLKEKEEKFSTLHNEIIKKLEEVAGLTRDEAKDRILVELDKELIEEKGTRIRQMEEDIKTESDKKAKDILVNAMRYADTDYVAEYTVSRVKLPDADVKGRIIGKDGRNIRAFESATGVDVELGSEENENEVIISSYDSVRREIARVALNRLLTDGRIQPAKIEEIVAKTQKDIERLMFEEGERLVHSLKIYSLPRELIEYLGRFRYRFSYGQNLLKHTLEETKLGVKIAHEIGADVNIVKLGCLMHDIGKIVNDKEGSHVDLGVELLEKFKIDKKVIDCVAEHHEDRAFSSNESIIVHIADSISGARPGARYEDFAEYVKRMGKLEDAAKSFEGISKVFAISAGRELRVIVNPENISDNQAATLAHDIAKKIEKEQTYPGTVKVNVVREVRYSDVAK